MIVPHGRARDRSRRRNVRALLGALGIALSTSPASALPEVLFGFDLDQISTPRFTQAGFQSVTTCSFASGQTPGAACAAFATFVPDGTVGAGYLTGKRPFTDFRNVPLVPDADANLWSDGHLAPPGSATLRISGLAPGASYTLLLFGRGGAALIGAKTLFDVDGLPVGSLDYNPLTPGDLRPRETLSIPVVVGANGWIDVGFGGDPGFGNDGILSGIALAVIPEPASGALLAAGLGCLVHLRRRASMAG